MRRLTNHPKKQVRTAMEMLCGDLLGCGISRSTYALKYTNDKVIKLEVEGSDIFQNVVEYRTWNFIDYDPKIRDFFAPCYEISPCGSVLIQARTTPLPDDITEIDIPHFVGDFKRENLGMLDGRVVFHDYGLLNPASYKKLRMLKVKPY